MASWSRTLYVGVTNDLQRRVTEHKARMMPGFSAKYHTTRLVWYQEFQDVHEAIACEKRIKGWRRSKKLALIESANPDWEDLAAP
ncbi:MAG: GIY-YIG nuclease family protein [Anaerolineae bacterium]|nr:GIY-YIG nuclease family protein [Anaerolineae bacterium]